MIRKYFLYEVIIIIFFNSCSLLPEDEYKSCRFSGECYSISEKDKDKALEQCKVIAAEHNKGSYFVLLRVDNQSCN